MNQNKELTLPSDYMAPDFESQIPSWKEFTSDAIAELWHEFTEPQKKALALNFQALHNFSNFDY